jgi:uncharacterized membrane protein YgaE (UPF0421/DUF939 family)
VNRLRLAVERLRTSWVATVAIIVAATLAWVLDVWLIGHSAPFFAPAAAVIVLSQAHGMRIRRALDVLLGVAGGILVADIVAQLLGERTTLTVVVLLVLTISVSTAFGASSVFTVQAAVSALYVAVVSPPTQTLVPVRFIDALVGGGLALLANQILVSKEPLAPIIREMTAISERVCQTVATTAAAVETHDAVLAQSTLEHARATDAMVEALRSAVAAAREALTFDLVRRQQRDTLGTVSSAVRQIDFAVRGVRVLARATLTWTRWPDTPVPRLATALRHLAAAIGYAGESLIADLRGDAEMAQVFAERVEAACLAALADARRVLNENHPLPVVMIIGQLRSVAIDLMRGVGGDDWAVLADVDRALGFPTG